jgi:hypothetical protein
VLLGTGVFDFVGVNVLVKVDVGTSVSVGVKVFVGTSVFDGVLVIEAVKVLVGVNVGGRVRLAVKVRVGVLVFVAVGAIRVYVRVNGQFTLLTARFTCTVKVPLIPRLSGAKSIYRLWVVPPPASAIVGLFDPYVVDV